MQALSADFEGVQRVLGGAPMEVVVGAVEGGLPQWMDVFRVTQVAMFSLSLLVVCVLQCVTVVMQIGC